MARPESQALAGYFPTPEELLPSLASLVEFPRSGYSNRHQLFDPCAGDGSALFRLKGLWWPDPKDENQPRMAAIEMEHERARTLQGRGYNREWSLIEGDSFCYRTADQDREAVGVSLLFLNPPYDVDRVHGRLEQRFLERWTSSLAPSTGMLMFLVPHYALSASADFIARHYQDIKAWRFPGDHFKAYRQVVLVAVRRNQPALEAGFEAMQIRGWAEDASGLPELHELPQPAYINQTKHGQCWLLESKVDYERLLRDFRPWADSTLVATPRTVKSMIGARYPVALPPPPAHIAMALSIGALNGFRLEPDSAGLPPLLVKGIFRREFTESEKRYDKEGNLTGTVMVQRPKLAVHVLDLTTLRFHELRNEDRFTELSGALWGAMSEAPSLLDRCTDDLPPFILKYPDNGPKRGEVVVDVELFPASWRTPKERWILRRVEKHLADGRNVLIFLRHTGKSGLAKRWQRLFKADLGETSTFLDVGKVNAANREAWLDETVIAKGQRILITNPKAVQTGLNNLVHFSAVIWVEGVDYDARVVRQANGRVHRIGQTRDVIIEVPYYADTVQKAALDLVAAKLTASVQVDGVSIEGALESAGAGESEDAQAAMSMGQALYKAWVAGPA